jgi:hypothetical protein
MHGKNMKPVKVEVTIISFTVNILCVISLLFFGVLIFYLFVTGIKL